MKIAVDIDDTLNVVERVKYAGAYIARKNLPYRLKDENSNMFLNVYDWNMDEVLRFIREGGEIAFTDAKAREGAREALEGWRKEGHEIVILSSRQKEWFGNPEKLSRDWLEKRRIPYDAIVTETWDKGRYCAEHGISVLVEDNPDLCLAAQERGVYAVLAIGKHNASRAEEIFFGGANWAAIDKAVRRIAHVYGSEEQAARACPARNTEMLDGWELRSDSWSACRGNHIRAVAPSLQPFGEKIALCEEKRAREGKPARFRLTALDGALERALQSRGYVVELSAVCMSLEKIPAYGQEADVRLSDDPGGWFRDYYAVIGQTCALRSYALISGKCIYAAAYSDGVPVAVGMGVLDGETVGIYDLRVHTAYRRRGYGRAVVKALLAEGTRSGAVRACLQAEAENTAAVALYRSLGFTKDYECRYRRKD